MTPVVLAVATATGVALMVLPERHGTAASRRVGHRGLARETLAARLAMLGLDDAEPRELAAVIATVGLVGAFVGWAVFAGPLPAMAVGSFAATAPVASARVRARIRRARALDAWPNLIEELRIRTGSLGRSIPQALFDVGLRGPVELRPAFAAAHREWLLSTDFARTLRVLRDRLGDPTADVVCETLLVAHEIGGSDLDRRLAALAEDRAEDRRYRKDANARLAGRSAGARFARRFVLAVPAGMALAGMAVGEGRSAYATPFGQVMVVAALVVLAACWLWAGRIMRLPSQVRVRPR